MKKITLLLSTAISSFLLLTSLTLGTSYKLDTAHSTVGFKVKHLVISNVNGTFPEFTGEINFNESDLKNAYFKGIIDVKSVDTNNEERDNHLKSEDFFDTKKFPHITFESTSVEANEDGSFQVTGSLTIKETTKTISFPLEVSPIVKGPHKKNRRGFAGSFKINRKDYGINWSKTLDTGTAIVAETVTIYFEIEGIN